MITKWKLFNFKSVRDETSLDFGPLTIFAGPNNSGKSTCIQSILLICQTLRSQIGSRSVILNGALSRLGQFSDLRTTGSDANQILIGWELRPASADRLQAGESYGPWDEEWVSYELEEAALISVECEVGFDATLDSPNDVTQLNPQLFSTVIRVTIRDADNVDHLIPFGLSRRPDAGESQIEELRRLAVSDAELDRVRSWISMRVEMDEESQQELGRRFVSGQAVGCDLLHFLPRRIALAYNRAEDQTHALTNGVLGIGRIPARWRSRSKDLYVPVAGLRVLRRIVEPPTGSLFESRTDLDKILLADEPVLLSFLLDAIRALPSARRRQVQEVLQGSPTLADQFSAAVRSELKDEYTTALTAPSRGVQVSCHYMQRYFSRGVKYLGPLRDEPKALYPLASGTDPLDIGLQGENTAAVLDCKR